MFLHFYSIFYFHTFRLFWKISIVHLINNTHYILFQLKHKSLGNFWNSGYYYYIPTLFTCLYCLCKQHRYTCALTEQCFEPSSCFHYNKYQLLLYTLSHSKDEIFGQGSKLSNKVNKNKFKIRGMYSFIISGHVYYKIQITSDHSNKLVVIPFKGKRFFWEINSENVHYKSRIWIFSLIS